MNTDEAIDIDDSKDIISFRYKFDWDMTDIIPVRRIHYPSNTQIRIALIENQIFIHDVVLRPSKYRHPLQYIRWKRLRKRLVFQLIEQIRIHNHELQEREQ